jgi:hypothetical protein
MSLSPETPNEVDEDTRKTPTVMDQLRAALHAATNPAVRAEIRDEMSCVALSWYVRQMLIDDAD